MGRKPCRSGPARSFSFRAGLKGLVARAERDQAELEALRAAGDEAGARDRLWADALAVAAGDRKPADAAKLRKALKLREKKKLKSAREWKKRGREMDRHFAAKTVPNGRRKDKDDGE